MIGKLILFGATGDLTGRYLLPALASLLAAGKLADGLDVVGVGRDEWDDATFQSHALQRLERHAAHLPIASREAVAAALRYRRVELDDTAGIGNVVHETSGPGDAPVAAYLALPPHVYRAAITAIGAAGLPSGSRIVVEKPYGEDLESTAALNALLSRVSGGLGKEGVFRVDHVLGMATAQNLLGLRFANPTMEAVWNSGYIDQVDVLWEESLALEGRAGFYDRTGALKDVMQNHMLQVLCLMAMEPPASLAAKDLRDARLAVLRSVRPMTAIEMASRTRRGRYTAGRVGDRVVPSYVEEEGVDPARCTETFAEAVLEVETPRWSGTRFVLRAGKALRQFRREAAVHFRPFANPPFVPGTHEPIASELRIGIDGPEDIVMRLVGSVTGPPPSLAPLALSGPPPPSDLPAYAHVLLDVLSGGSALSLRGDEAEQEWRVVTPILRAWADGRVSLQEYPAGSDGPPPIVSPRRGAG